MTPTCHHWQPSADIVGGGACRTGHFGGRPNFAACAVCEHWSGPEQAAYRQHWQVAVIQLHPQLAATIRRPGRCGGCPE